MPGWQVYQTLVLQPVQVFQSLSRGDNLACFLASQAAVSRPLEIIPHIDVLRSVEDICHDDEIDALDPRRPRKLDLMEADEASDHGMWVG